MNTEERHKYFNSLNKYRTNLSVMEYATEEGLEKGREEGRIIRALSVSRAWEKRQLSKDLRRELPTVPFRKI